MENVRIKKSKIFKVNSLVRAYEVMGEPNNCKIVSNFDLGDINGDVILNSGYDLTLPVNGSNYLRGENFVKGELEWCDTLIVVSDFDKGGALETISMNLASDKGKLWIKSAGISTDSDVDLTYLDNRERVENSKAEAVKSVVDYVPLLCINILEGDVYVSADPVALDYYCYEYITNNKFDHSFTKQADDKYLEILIESSHMLGVGEKEYEIIDDKKSCK